MTDELLKIIDSNTDDLKSFLEKRMLELNENSIDYYDISLSDEGSIYSGWIDMATTYLPLGIKAKGFKVDFRVIKDFVYYVSKNKLVTSNLDTIINYVHDYCVKYFGGVLEEYNRRRIYRFGREEYIGNSIRLSEIKDKCAAGPFEISVLENTLLNFIGFDSSLVISDVNDSRCAYCLIKADNKYRLSGPYSLVLDVCDNNYEFDTSLGKIIYDFPTKKLEKVKKKGILI